MPQYQPIYREYNANIDNKRHLLIFVEKIKKSVNIFY